MGITEEYAIGAPSLQAVVEGQRYHVFEVLRVFIGPHWRIQVSLIWKVDAFQYCPSRVEQVSFVPEAADPILCQVPVGAGAGSPRVPAVKAQLVAPAVVLGTHIGTWGENRINPVFYK